ncbi:HERV-H LTR-associating protein 2 [Salminus brasiliensis]|uniref:HERV-H LTR-associating protein 2 n=1 Tax=Salminus brasiliensis TaxID=930266 RepID=UPI003B82C96F
MNINQMIRTIILLWLPALTVGTKTVTCLFSKECMLPCQSVYHNVIHWNKDEKNLLSFFEGKMQLGNQDEDYKGRADLFSDQIPKGNISMILGGIRIQDEGKYKCYTAIKSDNQESFVYINVKAPIKSVDMKTTDKGITCTTSEVYPRPKISWNVKNSVQGDAFPDSRGLFSLNSTLSIQSVQNNFTYTCIITSEDGTQTYTASLKLVSGQTEIDSGEDATIYCPDPQGETENVSLILTFNGFSKVLSYNKQTSQPINTKWMDTEAQITPEGNIKLHKLDSEKYTGNYTCERSTAHSRQVIQTSVQVKPAGVPAGVIAIIVIGIGAVIGALIFIILYKKKTCPFHGGNSTGVSISCLISKLRDQTL